MTPQKVKILATARHARVRKKVKGTASRPRMSVTFTGKNIYVQFVDDRTGETLASASTTKMDRATRRANARTAATLGEMAASAAKSSGLSEVVFDRGGSKYHGKVKALADAARNNGLIF